MTRSAFRILVTTFICFITFGITADVDAFTIGYAGATPNHENITRNALWFLRAEPLEAIVDGNKAVDLTVLAERTPLAVLQQLGLPAVSSPVSRELLDEPTSSSAHFDDCQFRQSTQRINRLYRAIRDEYGSENLQPFQIEYLFGQILHTVQDFYAHSNWVELERTDLAETGFSFWWPQIERDTSSLEGRRQLFYNLNNGVILLQGTEGDAVTQNYLLFRDEGSSIVTVNTITPSSESYLGVITGTYDHSECPETIAMPHGTPLWVGDAEGLYDGWEQGDLNKDQDREQQGDFFEQAYSLAVAQTRHEWCRLLSLVSANQSLGITAAQEIIDRWVRDDRDARAAAYADCPVVASTATPTPTFTPPPRVAITDDRFELFNSLIVSAGGSTDYTITSDVSRDSSLIDGVTMVSAPTFTGAEMYCTTLDQAVTSYAITAQNASVRAPIIVASGFAPDLLSAFYLPTLTDQLASVVTESRFIFLRRSTNDPWEIYPESVVAFGWGALCETALPPTVELPETFTVYSATGAITVRAPQGWSGLTFIGDPTLRICAAPNCSSTDPIQVAVVVGREQIAQSYPGNYGGIDVSTVEGRQAFVNAMLSGLPSSASAEPVQIESIGEQQVVYSVVRGLQPGVLIAVTVVDPGDGTPVVLQGIITESTSDQYLPIFKEIAASVILVGLDAPPPAEVLFIQYGDTVTGNLVGGAPVLYQFTGAAGDQVTINLSSDDYDTLLRLQDVNGDEVAYNDDSGGTRNSEIILDLAEDGDYVIVADSWSGEASGEFSLSLETGAAEMEAPAVISGPQIAFESNGSIWLMNADGTLQRPLTSGSHDSRPSWSPDGQQIVFLSLGNNGYDDIFVMNADGSGVRQLTDTGLHEHNPVWLPDGQHIGYAHYGSGRTSSIYVMDSATGNTEALMEGSYCARWSPDGRSIVYFRDGLYVTDAHGQNARLLLDGSSVSEFTACPVWSPDGTKLYTTLNSNIVEIDVESGSIRTISEEYASSLTLSPDGRTLAFSTSTAIYLISIADGQIEGPITTNFARSPAWQPDGTVIPVPALDPEQPPITPDDAPLGGGPTVTPTATQTAILAGTPTAQATLVPSTSAPDLIFMSYGDTVTGSLVNGRAASYVFTGAARDQVTINLASTDFDTALHVTDELGFDLDYNDDSNGTDNSQIVFTVPWDGYYFIVVDSAILSATGAFTLSLEGGNTDTLASGQQIAFERGGDIWLMNADGISQRPVTSGLIASNPNWSPDGQQIVFVAPGSEGYDEIFVMDADGSNIRQLTRGNFDVQNPTWLPDGLQIGYSRYNGGSSSTYVLNVDTQRSRSLISGGTCPRWSPDGGSIAYIEYYGGLLYVADASGVNARELASTPSISNTVCPVWSPDGSRLYTVNDNGDAIVEVDTTSGTVRTIARQDARNLTISPDGGMLAVSNSTGIYLVDITNGTVVGPIAPTNSEEPAWQPSATADSATIRDSSQPSVTNTPSPTAAPPASVLPLPTPLSPLTSGSSSSDPIILSYGDTVTGTMVNGVAPQYTFAGVPGDEVTITLESSEFDPVLELTDLFGSVVGSNDNFNGTNAQISLTLPAGGGGIFYIQPSSYSTNGTGSFTVSLTQGAGTAATAAVPPTDTPSRPTDAPTPTVSLYTGPARFNPNDIIAMYELPDIRSRGLPALYGTNYPILGISSDGEFYQIENFSYYGWVRAIEGTVEGDFSAVPVLNDQGTPISVSPPIAIATSVPTLVSSVTPPASVLLQPSPTNIPLPTQTPAPSATPVTCPGTQPTRLAVGQTARVIVEGGNTANRIRSQATASAGQVGSIPPGDEFTIIDGPICADGYAWWMVDYDGLIGWTAEGDAVRYWLEPLGGAPVIVPTAPPMGVLYVGGQATVFTADEGLKLRDATNTNSNILENMPSGIVVTLLEGPVSANGYVWWRVLSPSGREGWSVESADGIETLIPVDVSGVATGGTAVCSAITTPGDTNLRRGPGTTFEIAGVVGGGMEYTVIGQAINQSGFTWYQFENNLWARQDVVELQGDCTNIPMVR